MTRRLFLVVGPFVALSVFIVCPGSSTLPSIPASTQTLRVMTYNIHVGVGIDKKLDLPRIAGVINAQHPDLVGLQEVDRGVARTQRIDEIAEIAKLTRMDYAFAFNLRYQGGQYGVAILSRFPIMATDYYRGWAKSRLVTPPPTGTFAPDKSVPAADTGTLTAGAIPVFFENNPVTHKPVALPAHRNLHVRVTPTKTDRVSG